MGPTSSDYAGSYTCNWAFGLRTLTCAIVCVCGTQPDPLSHYFYFTLLGAVAAKSYAVNLYVGNSANLFNYVRLNELDGSYIYGAITPATAPYRPSYTVNQPSYCEPLNLSCPLSPVGAPTVTNITYYPTQRIWYQGVIANRGPAFTPVYWFASGGLGVTAAMPFFVNQTRLQAPPGYQQSWYSSVFAPTPAPAGSTVQQAAGDDISLLGLSLALANVITAAKFPTNSTLVFVVETNTDFLIAASSVPSQLYVLPKNCTSSCINNCCRVQATESSDENVANAAVRARGTRRTEGQSGLAVRATEGQRGPAVRATEGQRGPAVRATERATRTRCSGDGRARRTFGRWKRAPAQ